LTKKGLVSVLVIKPITGSAAYAELAAKAMTDNINLGALNFMRSPEGELGSSAHVCAAS
jgi:hypothetical protein